MFWAAKENALGSINNMLHIMVINKETINNKTKKSQLDRWQLNTHLVKPRLHGYPNSIITVHTQAPTDAKWLTWRGNAKR